MSSNQNELGLLNDEDYNNTFKEWGGGSNFVRAKSHEVLARALVTCLFEQNFLNRSRIVGPDSDLLEFMLIIKNALSEGAHIEIKERFGPLYESLNTALEELKPVMEDVDDLDDVSE